MVADKSNGTSGGAKAPSRRRLPIPASRAALLAALALAPSPAAAAAEPVPAALVVTQQATVAGVLDGDTVALDGGAEVRLLGLQAPKPLPGNDAAAMRRLAEAARATLARLVEGRRVGLADGGRDEDRYGRRLAHLVRDDGVWVQAALLESGMARVASAADARVAVDAMLALEGEARAARRGIWAEPAFRIRTADEAAALVDSFQVVEGTVVDAALVRGRVYLNFGADWREDFTVTIAPGDRSLFTEAGHDPAAWRGRRIRVRGWIGWRNGPVIAATHPEQIEVLEHR